ncbi:predicted protein [Chaetoceros tenuissimus]|uniref:Uncharacterized protein n=1 Tax=Chaetoceros tenuissimus TaxID=426638 RepID=A0AAD3CIE2_9STRA|nr:predicted protein [Chaetoceros tenuissimus]
MLFFNRRKRSSPSSSSTSDEASIDGQSPPKQRRIEPRDQAATSTLSNQENESSPVIAAPVPPFNIEDMSLLDLLQGIVDPAKAKFITDQILIDRIQAPEHKREVTPRAFFTALMTTPLISPSVIQAFLRTKDVLTKDSFLFLMRSPWMTLDHVNMMLDTEQEQIYKLANQSLHDRLTMDRRRERANGNLQEGQEEEEPIPTEFPQDDARIVQIIESFTSIAGKRRMKLVEASVTLLKDLESTKKEIPPKLNVVKSLLRPFLARSILRHGMVPRSEQVLHKVCSRSDNIEYVKLFITVIKEVAQQEQDALQRQRDAGEVVEENDHDSILKVLFQQKQGYPGNRPTPLCMVARDWDKSKAAEIITLCLNELEFTEDSFPESILPSAVEANNVDLVKSILNKMPSLVFKRRAFNKYPALRCLPSPYSGTPKAWISLIMRGIRYSRRLEEGHQLKYVCGLLAVPSERGVIGPIQHLGWRSLLVTVCNPIVKYLMETIDKSSKETRKAHCIKNLMVLIHQLAKENKWFLIQEWISKYPSIVEWKDLEGNLLAHLVAKYDAPISIFKSVVNSGFEKNVGGTKGRGGLNVPNADGKTAIVYVSMKKQGPAKEIYKFLSQSKSQKGKKLLHKSDYKKLNLLHNVAASGKVHIAKKYLEDSPDRLLVCCDEKGRLPLHYVCEREPSVEQFKMFKLIFEKGRSQLEGMGGLLLVDDEGKSPLSLLIKNLHWNQKKWKSINYLYAKYKKKLPILQSAADSKIYGGDFLRLIKNFPLSHNVKDEYGRLPLHALLDVEDFDNFNVRVVNELLKLTPNAVSVRCGCTGLYPFQSAIANTKVSKSTAYEILRMDPTVLEK